MLLQGSLHEFGLSNVLQLIKMSAKTGVLTLRRSGAHGQLFFRNGNVYFAYVHPQVLPLGERLLRAGKITAEQLDRALAEQREGDRATRVGAILITQGDVDRGTLAEAIADQIEEAAFNLLSWTEGEFEFQSGGASADEDIIVELTVDGVLIEGVRRLDEWDLIMASLGSLQHIPHLLYDEAVAERGGITLTPEEWRVISIVDGRRDTGSVMRDSGIPRFQAAKVLYKLLKGGYVTMRQAAIQGLEDATAVIVASPIDFYNEVFLSTLNDEGLTHHLLTDVVGEEDVELPITAVTLPHEEDAAGPETLVFAVAAGVRVDAWCQLARRCAGCVLLVNANSVDSARASLPDIAALADAGGLPYVVVPYVSVSEEPLGRKAVAAALSLPDDVQVTPCELRDRVAVAEVIETVLALAEERDRAAQEELRSDQT